MSTYCLLFCLQAATYFSCLSLQACKPMFKVLGLFCWFYSMYCLSPTSLQLVWMAMLNGKPSVEGLMQLKYGNSPL